MGQDRQGRPKNKRSKKELGGERRKVYKESERARRGRDLRELFWRRLQELTEAPIVIKKAILDPRIKADSEPAKLYMREPNWKPLQLKTCDTAIPESANKADFGTVEIVKEQPYGGF
ncbi:hypothetical protein TNCV_2301371 [Trichonephila clavipes]|nr:hypothetical protein TNCV_2301371 [Trichonephila clavipes]